MILKVKYYIEIFYAYSSVGRFLTIECCQLLNYNRVQDLMYLLLFDITHVKKMS